MDNDACGVDGAGAGGRRLFRVRRDVCLDFPSHGKRQTLHFTREHQVVAFLARKEAWRLK